MHFVLITKLEDAIADLKTSPSAMTKDAMGAILKEMSSNPGFAQAVGSLVVELDLQAPMVEAMDMEIGEEAGGEECEACDTKEALMDDIVGHIAESGLLVSPRFYGALAATDADIDGIRFARATETMDEIEAQYPNRKAFRACKKDSPDEKITYFIYGGIFHLYEELPSGNYRFLGATYSIDRFGYKHFEGGK